MKRGQRFQTLGMRMLSFGRTLMRNYVAPESGIAPDAAEGPAVWTQEDATEQRFQPEPFIESDFDSSADYASSTDDAPPTEVQRAPQYTPPPEIQRAPQYASPPQPQSKPKLDPQLLRILAAHEQLDTRRDNIREEKKATFEATKGGSEANIQRDAASPPKRRRGRASFDYVETGPLRPVDSGAPIREQPPQMPLLDEDQEDTLPVEIPESSIQRAPTFDNSMMDFDVAGDNNAWDESYQGAPEVDFSIDVSTNTVQRAPPRKTNDFEAVDTGDFDYSPGQNEAPPAMNETPINRVQRAPSKTPQSPTGRRQETAPQEPDDFEMANSGEFDYSAGETDAPPMINDVPNIQRAPSQKPQSPRSHRQEAASQEANNFEMSESREFDYSPGLDDAQTTITDTPTNIVQRVPSKTPQPLIGRREIASQEANNFEMADSGEVDYSAGQSDAPPAINDVPNIQRAPSQKPQSPRSRRQEAASQEANNFEMSDSGEFDYSPGLDDAQTTITDTPTNIVQRVPSKTPQPPIGRREIASQEANNFEMADSGEFDYSAGEIDAPPAINDAPIIQRAPSQTPQPPRSRRQEAAPPETNNFEMADSGEVDYLQGQTDAPPAINDAPTNIVQRAPTSEKPPVKGRREAAPQEANDFEMADSGEFDYSAGETDAPPAINDTPPNIVQRAPTSEKPPVKGRREAAPQEANNFEMADSGEFDYSAGETDAPPAINDAPTNIVQRAPSETPRQPRRREAPPMTPPEMDRYDAAPPSETWHPGTDEFENVDFGESEYPPAPPENIQRTSSSEPRTQARRREAPPMTPPETGHQAAPPSETWHPGTDEFENVDFGESEYAPAPPENIQRASSKNTPPEFFHQEPADQTIERWPEAQNQPAVQRTAWQDEVDDEGATEPLDMEAIRGAIEATNRQTPPPEVQRATWQDEVDDEGATEPLDMEAIRGAIEATSRNTPLADSTPLVESAQNNPTKRVQRIESNQTPPIDSRQNNPTKPIQQAQPYYPPDSVMPSEAPDFEPPINSAQNISTKRIQQAQPYQPPPESPISDSPVESIQDNSTKRIQRAQPYQPPSAPPQVSHNDIQGNNGDMHEQPIDLFEALSQAGMIPGVQRTESPRPNPENVPDDLLDFLNNAPPPPNVGGQQAIQRSSDESNGFTHYEAPMDQVMREETSASTPSTTSDSSTSAPEEDVDIDKIAREVYSRLRNRLRIERERRDK